MERETRELQSQLQKAERAAALARDKEEREKAKRFSERMQTGTFMKQPKAVMLVAEKKKKRKSLKTEMIKSADEEDEQDTIPEGFHLQAESLHCLNMERSEDYQAYLRQIVLEFERLLKAGGKDMRESYGEIIESFYWACMANKNNIIEGGDRDQVLQSIRDPDCKAWTLKLKGRKTVDPASIVDNLPIANSADYLASLCDMVSLAVTIKVMNATLRPVVAVRIPEVDDMIERAQEKVEAIKRAKEATAGARPIDERIAPHTIRSVPIQRKGNQRRTLHH